MRGQWILAGASGLSLLSAGTVGAAVNAVALNASGDWGDAANWNPQTVPDNTFDNQYDVTITDNAVTLNADYTIEQLNWSGGTIQGTNKLTTATLNLSGSAQLAGTATVRSGGGELAGTLDVAAGATVFLGDPLNPGSHKLTANSALSGAGAVYVVSTLNIQDKTLNLSDFTGPLQFTSGTLRGTGSVTGGEVRISGGSISPAHESIGTIQVQQLSFAPGGKYSLDIEDGEADRIEVSDSASLTGGELSIFIIGDPLEAVGQTILAASSISGRFAAVRYDFDEDYEGAYQLIYNADSVVLGDFSSVPEPSAAGLLAMAAGGFLRRSRRR